MEVLLEYKSSRRQLEVNDRDLICELVERELKKTGWNGEITLGLPEASSAANRSGEQPPIYLLQRWSERWGMFIDVTTTKELKEGDRLTVIPKPMESPMKVKELTAKAESIFTRVKKPTEVEAKTLAQLFPASTPIHKRPLQAFDPTAQCVASAQKAKRKASCPRPASVEVFLMKHFQGRIPKGNQRSLKASNRCKKITVNRQMNAAQVKTVIMEAFSDQPEFQSFSVLECQANNCLQRASYELRGDVVMDRRGALYLCEESSDTEDNTEAKRRRKDIQERASEMIRILKAPPKVDDTDRISVSSSDSEPDESASSHMAMRQAEILESRQIMKEQDEAFAESLHIDREKAAKRKKEEEEKERTELLRCELQKRLEMQPAHPEAIKVCLRLLDSTKVEVNIASFLSAKAMYEVAFAKSSITSPFYIYSIAPRQLIPPNASISQLHLQTPCVLVVEECDTAPNLWELLGETSAEEMVDMSADKGKSEDIHVPETGIDLLREAESKRECFMESLEDVHLGVHHDIKRDNVFEEVIRMYKTSSTITVEFPFRVTFQDERAVDTGGVSRDMFCAFWSSACQKIFDGAALLIPAVHPHVDMSIFPVLGAVLSHGYLACGVFPVCVAFPILACSLLGPTTSIPVSIIRDTFVDYVSSYDGEVLKEAFSTVGECTSSFSTPLATKLIGILSHFGCRQVPTPLNINCLVSEVAHHEFMVKPLGAVYAISSGIPTQHLRFWKTFSVEALYSLYKALNATPARVLEMLVEPEAMNSAQDRVFGYLNQYIGNLNTDELRLFLRFVTGSSVCLGKEILVTFNTLSGLGRRPLTHACSCTIELPSTYSTYPEFANEFNCILSSEFSWIMDAV